MMTLNVASATDHGVSGTIAKPYPDWVAYGCGRNEPELIDVEKGNLPIVVGGAFEDRCATLTWRDGEVWRTATPGAESSQYVDPKKQLGAR